MKNPKISLVIPAHNEEKYIGKCLDSAIQNSGGKFHEIIVVDNASGDKTSEEATKRHGVKVVREERKGLTRARQCGFESATGDILAYCDADTLMPAGWYEHIAREFANNENLACLSGPYLYYDIPRYQQHLVSWYWNMLAYPAYLAVGYMTVGGNFAIRKEVLEKMNGFDTSIEFYGEDTDIARRAHNFGKVKFKPNFKMSTSGRRLSKQGLFSTTTHYVFNFLSIVLLHRPVTESYKDLR